MYCMYECICQEPSRSIFGFFSVPTKAYPLILLVLLSVRIPSGLGSACPAAVVRGLISDWLLRCG